MCNTWWARIIATTIVAIAFLSFLVVASANFGVGGRIVNKQLRTCLVAVPSPYPGLAPLPAWRRGLECDTVNAQLDMEADGSKSPIVWKSFDEEGKLWCLDNMQPALRFEECADDRINQSWTFQNGHLISDAAAEQRNPSSCVVATMSMLGGGPIAMGSCAIPPASGVLGQPATSNVWQFRPLTV